MLLDAYGVGLRLVDFQISNWQRIRDPEVKVAWYVVLAVILLALGATIALGALLYCMARGKHLSATVNIGDGKYLVGCK